MISKAEALARGILIAVAIIGGAGLSILVPPDHPSKEELAPAEIAKADLLVEDVRCVTQSGYVGIYGHVTNRGQWLLRDIMAFGMFYSGDGSGFSTQADGTVDSAIVSSGDRTSFQVMTRDDPRIDSCSVSFVTKDSVIMPAGQASVPLER